MREDRRMDILFIAGSILLGAGLAMDAFSVSVANAVSSPGMGKRRALAIAGTFAFFQFLMPLAGWLAVHTIIGYFRMFAHLIPWIALALLSLIGGRMVLEGIRGNADEPTAGPGPGTGALLIQGVATSIDALSTGFTIAEYDALQAFVCAGIIAAVTFALCSAGLALGRRIGIRAGERAGIAGGIILICIGIMIFVRHFAGI